MLQCSDKVVVVEEGEDTREDAQKEEMVVRKRNCEALQRSMEGIYYCKISPMLMKAIVQATSDNEHLIYYPIKLKNDNVKLKNKNSIF